MESVVFSWYLVLLVALLVPIVRKIRKARTVSVMNRPSAVPFENGTRRTYKGCPLMDLNALALDFLR